MTDQTRVALIVGDERVRYCGVRDYALTLAAALSRLGVQADVVAPSSWSLPEFLRFRRHLRKSHYDIVHVQYPAIGFRTSLVPQLLGFLRTAPKCLVTLHDYSSLPPHQRFSTHLFRGSASAILFSGEYERQRYERLFGRIGAKRLIVPIGSNVPSAPPSPQRQREVVYFGQLRPGKGVEDFLELATSGIQSGRSFVFHVIGSAPRAHRAWAEALRESSDASIRWSFDLDAQAVAERLQASFAAYLPFPDGASERRGSILAAVTNGLPLLSRKGEATPPALFEVFRNVGGAAEALKALDELDADPALWQRMRQAALKYALRHSWDQIAKEHAKIYGEVLKRPVMSEEAISEKADAASRS
jgi:glycosyltransferase involved in cell wall biosynthesis